MDRSPLERYDPAFTIVFGFALLLNPFVVGAFDVGDPDWYRYEAAQVEFYGNGTYDVEGHADVADPEVACLEFPPSRPCMLERAVHERGGITYDGAPRAFLQHPYEYVYVWKAGFFAPNATELPNGTVRYSLDPVPAERALQSVATPVSDASRGVRAAVRTGQFETSDELAGANELVAANGEYYVVHATAYAEDNTTERSGFVVLLQWVLGVAGAGLVLQGQRKRTRRDMHESA